MIFNTTDIIVTNPHASHFSLDQSVDAAKQVNAFKTYFVGFTHRVDHYELEENLKKLEATEGLRISPSYDGLKVSLENDNKLIELSYFDQTPITVK